MSDKAIDLSILVPTMNSDEYIYETISRILKINKDAKIEIIVSDNFSNDKTREILEGFDDIRLRLVYWESRMSAADHWTKLSHLANGEFTKLVCADDVVFANAVIEQLEIAKSDEHLAMVSSPRNIISNSGRTLYRNKGLASLKGSHNGHNAIKICVSSGTNLFGEPMCVLFRTSHLKNSLPWSEKFPYVIDLDMYSKVLNSGNFYGLTSSVGAFRLSSSSWSRFLVKSQVENFNSWLDFALEEKFIKLSEKELSSAKHRASLQGLRRRFVMRIVSFLSL